MAVLQFDPHRDINMQDLRAFIQEMDGELLELIRSVGDGFASKEVRVQYLSILERRWEAVDALVALGGEL